MASKQTKMPTHPGARLLAVGGLALTGVKGVLREGARQLASGQRPTFSSVVFSGNTGIEMADQLAKMRGAAMKVGQLLSMDSGDILPPEFSQALARLQQSAHIMPQRQLELTLRAAWGERWREHFRFFDPIPIAAASIGQVHKATLKSGQTLAIKVQFPRVKDSIDSDIANISGLLKTFGLADTLGNLGTLTEDARVQLHQEADYQREADWMMRYRAALHDQPQYLVPAVYAPLLRDTILPMDFITGEDLDHLIKEPQSARDAVTENLFSLALKELFDLGFMQTDPNFANYKWVRQTGQIALFDFGATRPIEAQTVQAYRALIQSGLARDTQAIKAALINMGIFSAHTAERYAPEISSMIGVTLRHFHQPRIDFSDRAFVPILKSHIQTLALDRSTWRVPSSDILYVQRKLSGTALLGVKLKAKLPLRDMVMGKAGLS